MPPPSPDSCRPDEPNVGPNVPIESCMITIPENAERCRRSVEACRVVGLEPHILEHPRDHDDPQRGCWNAHVAAARHGLSRDMDRLLILEDDVEWEGTDDAGGRECVERAIRAVDDAPLGWRVVFLGHMPSRPMWNTRVRGLVFTPRSRFAHAYILSREGMRALVGKTYEAEERDIQTSPFSRLSQRPHVDRIIGDMGHTYAVHPQLAFQRDLPTSNGSTALYRVLAGLRNAVTYRRLARTTERLMMPW